MYIRVFQINYLMLYYQLLLEIEFLLKIIFMIILDNVFPLSEGGVLM